MLTITLFLLFSVLWNINSQFIPPQFDLAINRLRQYQYFSPIDLLKDVEYNPTPKQMLEHMSVLLSNNKTSPCEQDIELILRAAVEKEMWALKILDAWGKPLPSGILKGNMYWIGNYDECIQPIYNPANQSFVSQPFNTQHCTLTPTASRSRSSSMASLVLGLCVPSSCDRQTLVSLIHTLFKNLSITQENLVCSNDLPNGQKGLTNGAIATIVILSLLGLLVLVGTIIDLISMLKFNIVHNRIISNNTYNHLVDDDNEITTQSETHRTSKILFLAEFSALKSLRRIFTLEQKTNDDTNDSFLFINGIRVLSLCWIIIGHSLLFNLSYTSNIIDILVSSRTIAFQLILSAHCSVDTFFVLSGFFTAILFIRQVKKEGKLSLRLMYLYYIHRYIRLTPAFLLMILVSINLTPYFGQGPIYPFEQGFESKGCRTRSWWTSILYVGNIVRPDEMCLNIAWYLHNDMQFHWIAPLTLIPFALGRRTLSFIIAIVFVLVGIGSILTILLYYPNMILNTLTTETNNDGPSFYNNVYIKPWCRISAYAIGLLTGYIVIITGREYHINRRNKIIVTILIIIIGFMWLLVTNSDSIRASGLSRPVTVVYMSLSRTLWSIVIGWLLFICSINQGGIVTQILSWPIWTSLARINYSCYLVHSTILHIIIFNQTMPFYYQRYLAINNFISHIFFSYAAAILVSIFFETPFFIMEKKLFKR
ncbi:unnamed protein product [Adineta steineri]|uniref:Nose resistant-to-fluoxetine protein N-terminal domain-containing protein n=1 Tax=Adineta steineri TaxID=433720 RepID=A0A814M255_9BILA|nr:unnamed protein product [Adineta steineri]CAF1163134.1 unnamed protein product [Adineta steineri]